LIKRTAWSHYWKRIQQKFTNIQQENSDSYTWLIGHGEMAKRFRKYKEEDTARGTKRKTTLCFRCYYVNAVVGLVARLYSWGHYLSIRLGGFTSLVGHKFHHWIHNDSSTWVSPWLPPEAYK
jgi:hypothetical protein